MILYRKAAQLRVRRSSAPEAPFWAATTIAPYGAKRTTPIAIDYLAHRATGAEKLEVPVAEHVRDDLERGRAFAEPVLIEAAESAEVVFRRGEEARLFCEERGLAAMQLVSTRGALPQRGTVVLSAWPLELARLETMFAEARENGLSWGVAVPVLYPYTTELAALEELADTAQRHGASFFAALGIELEPTAKQALAQSMNLSVEDDRYAMLFHSPLEPVHLATERHIAALAAAREMADFVVPPKWEQRTNWNAAVLLTRTASRMIAMELDLDLAGLIARSARTIAELDKQVTRVAESASLAIIGGLDETSVEMLTEWVGRGGASFADYVDEQWRLRRA
ncbi:MAG TPA: hypothetical protein VEK11_23855 [Thermoanaerobaculia bacterium]|nr:hypothetical protein [Thermoanaerobaculia bacterium]